MTNAIASIIFRAGLALFTVRGVHLPAPADATFQDFTFRLSVQKGEEIATVFEATGTPLITGAHRVIFRNRLAHRDGGIAKITLTPGPFLPGDDYWRLDVKGYGDFSAAGEDMRGEIWSGDNYWSGPFERWCHTRNGWRNEVQYPGGPNPRPCADFR